MKKINEISPIAGQRFGRWTVLTDFIINEKNDRKWLCLCDCGTKRYVLERSLIYGSSKSCGCLTRENAKKAVSKDLEGLVFGELTVLKRAENQRKSSGIWYLCKCECGDLYEAPATLLTTGKRTHCGNKKHRKNIKFSDISGKKFHCLTALRPTEKRDSSGSVIWICQCECGNEIEVSYNALLYGNMKSCGCKKLEHDRKLHKYLTHVDGTSVDMLKSKKIPTDNTSGCRGVYLIRGKYVAKIVFQKKAYYLGTFDNLEDAAKVRKEAELLICDGTAEFYEKWKEKADADPTWAVNNPIRITVDKDPESGLKISFLPAI